MVKKDMIIDTPQGLKFHIWKSLYQNPYSGRQFKAIEMIASAKKQSQLKRNGKNKQNLLSQL